MFGQTGLLPHAPEWEGWLALTLLVTGFCLIGWWLFFSPLAKPTRSSLRSPRVIFIRKALAAIVLFTAMLGTIGAHWDELWHRMYGGFGNDFLWPPHLVIYGSLGLTGALALIGMVGALGTRGSLRERVRAEPLMGLLGLIAAYQIASIPSDLLWHQIIGPDTSAWALPHLLLALTTTGTRLIGIAIALSTLPKPSWRNLFDRLRTMELIVLGLMGLILLSWLEFGTTEWEWIDNARIILGRPEWTYPVVTLLIGIGTAHLTLYLTRRIGAASLVSLCVLGVQVIVIGYERSVLPPGPMLASHLLLVPPGLALDGWCAAHRSKLGLARTNWGGAILYCVVFFALAFPYVARFMTIPSLDPIGLIGAIGIGTPAALILADVCSRLGTWLRLIDSAVPDEPLPVSDSAQAIRV